MRQCELKKKWNLGFSVTDTTGGKFWVWYAIGGCQWEWRVVRLALIYGLEAVPLKKIFESWIVEVTKIKKINREMRIL